MCDESKKIFIDKLVQIIQEKSSIDRTDIKQILNNWFNNELTDDANNDVINILFKTPDDKLFPIWWSGFWIEDPDIKTNPINDMNTAKNILNGWYSEDLLISKKANSERNTYWENCDKENKLNNFGNKYSSLYTIMSLVNNPDNIGLFINKDEKSFLESYFFTTEISIINEHYKNINKYVNFYIMNKKENCDTIVKILQKFSNINFICENNCQTLKKCAENIKEHIKTNYNDLSRSEKTKYLKTKREYILLNNIRQQT